MQRERFGGRVTVINDDKPLLQIGQKEIRVYGTPYGGKDHLQTNTSAPVAGIVILHQAKENAICRIPGRDAYPMLLNQTYRTKAPAGIVRTLNLVKKLAQLPVWSLGCTISQEAVALAAAAAACVCVAAAEKRNYPHRLVGEGTAHFKTHEIKYGVRRMQSLSDLIL